jgi:homoserine kinase
VPHGDAAQNAGRAALLVAALLTGADTSLLLDATDDLLHQPYRMDAMPESARLLRRLRERGVPAVISGAGPAVLAFTTGFEPDSIGNDVGKGWSIHPLNVEPHGAHVRTVGQ